MKTKTEADKLNNEPCVKQNMSDQDYSFSDNLENRRKEFKLANVPVILERSSENIINDYKLRYGFYDEKSKLHLYVDNITKEALGNNYSKVKIHIAKNTPHCEAFALPNGAIVISPQMIKIAKYRESLQALITHEAFHVIDEHSKKNLIESIKSNGSTRDNLKIVGNKRASEHLADLYQHLLATENENINPMGSVALLENIAEFSNQTHAGAVHGFTSDRALITEGIFYFYPFRNLSKELNEIPKEILDSIEDHEPFKRIDVSGRFDKGESNKKTHWKIKKEILTDLKPEDTPFYLNQIAEISEVNKRFCNLIKMPLDTLIDNYFSDELWDEEEPWVIGLDSAITLISENIYTEENLRNNENLEVINRWKNEEYEIGENFFKIGDVINDSRFTKIFSKHKLGIDKVIGFFKVRLSNYIELFEDNFSEEKLDSIDKLVCELAKAGERFSKNICIFPMLSEDIKNYLYNFLAKKVARADVKAYFRKFIKDNQLELTLEKIDKNPELKVVHRSFDLEMKIMKTQVEDDEQSTEELYEKLFIENIKNFSNILVNLINGSISIEEIYLIYDSVSSLAFTANETDSFYPEHYQLILLFSFVDAINKSDLDNLEKNNFLLNIISDSGIVRNTHKDINQEDDIESIRFDIKGTHRKLINKINIILRKSILGSIDDFLYKDLDRKELLLTLKTIPGAGTQTCEIADSINGYHYQCKILAKYLSRFNDVKELINEIEILEKKGLRVWDMVEDKFNIEQFAYIAYPFVKEIMDNGISREKIEDYRKLAAFIPDKLIRKSFLTLLNQKELEEKPYNERVDLIFKRIKKKLAGFTDLKQLSEKEVCRREDFEKLKESFKANFSCLHDINSAEVGAYALGSLVSTGTLASSFKSANLTIGKAANTKIRKLIIEKDNVITNALSREDSINLSKPETSKLNNMENSIFSVNNNFRRALLIRLLSGRNGLISNKGEYRKKFMSFLLNNILDESGDENLNSLLGDIVESSGEIITWKPLFFALQNLLVDYTLKPNMDVADWEDIISKRELEDEQSEKERYRKSKLNIKERKYEKYQELEEILDDPNEMPWRNKYKFSEALNLKVLDILEKEEHIEERTEFAELEVLDLILEVCQSAGALGVRFLQLFPLFTNLKPEYKDKFSKAFDKVDGQSRFVAIMTLDDNWDHFWDDVEYVYPGRIGGGSINTVLKLKMKENAYHPEFNGKTLTVKVRNPNLEFHLEETKKMLDEAIEGLIEIDRKYKTAKLIIDDVYLWIKNELNYKNYVQKDFKFHENLAEFNENSSGIEFITPETYSVPLKEGMTDTNQIIVEDYIESDQITDGFTNLEEKGYEMKTVVSNMIRNYCFQLTKGFANSDISIGNYLLAKSKESETLIAIIDKLYFLEFDESLKGNLKPLTILLQILSEDPKAYANRIRGDLNLSISDITLDKIEEQLNKLKEDFSSNDFSIDGAKEVFTNIVKLVPELDSLISKLSNKDVIFKDSESFVKDVFRIFNQETTETNASKLANELSAARSSFVSDGSADGILSFAKNIIEKINLNQESRELIEMLIGMYSFSVKSSDEKVKALNKLVTNKEFAVKSNTRESVKAVFDSAKERFKSNDFSGTMDMFHDLREIGLKFDIRITLALKNIFALHQMAIDAGFKNGFFEGLCFQESNK